MMCQLLEPHKSGLNHQRLEGVFVPGRLALGLRGERASSGAQWALAVEEQRKGEDSLAPALALSLSWTWNERLNPVDQRRPGEGTLEALHIYSARAHTHTHTHTLGLCVTFRTPLHQCTCTHTCTHTHTHTYTHANTHTVKFHLLSVNSELLVFVFGNIS